MSLKDKIKTATSLQDCNEKDEYTESYQMSKFKATYEKARQELEVQPYAIRMKPLDTFLFGFRSVYHFISVLLGLATCILISLIFVDIDGQSERFPAWLLILMAILIGGVLIGVLVGVELGKVTLAKNIFKAKAKREKVGIFSLVGLSFLVLLSIALSGVGGALLSYKVGDKSQVLNQALKVEEQKIATQFDGRLKQLNQVISSLENLSVDKKVRRWGLKESEQANLDNSKKEKELLILKRDKALNLAKNQHNKATQNNQTYTYQTIYVALALITFLELMTVYAYHFHYQYLTRTESEGVLIEVLPKQQMIHQEQHINTLTPAVTTSSTPTAQYSDTRIGFKMNYERIDKGTDTVTNSVKQPYSISDCVDVIEKYYHVAVANDEGLSINQILVKYSGNPKKSTIQKVRTVQRILRTVGKYDEVMESLREKIT